jgi:amino acid synthesis protein
MTEFEVRKITTTIEEIWHDGGPRLVEPVRVGLISAVVRNPDAGRYVEEIVPLIPPLKDLGLRLSRCLLDALGGDPELIEAYGKGAIVGVAGDIEYGALWHEAGGWSMREALGGRKAIVPSNKMIGAVGAHLQVPLGHTDAAFVRSHFVVTGMWVHDAPRPDEIVYGLAMSTGGRPNSRAGGLRVEDVKGNDGLR